MDRIRRQASKDEVGTAFHLPLATLAAAARLRPSMFRGGVPYWTIDVTDVVSKTLKDEGNPEQFVAKGEKVEVWGLTGWYLSLMLKRLRIYQ